MGRTQIIKKFEITEEFKELQALAQQIHFRGGQVRIDPIEETVTFLNGQTMNYADGKIKLEELLDIGKNSLGTQDYKDPEEEARRIKAEAKRQKKHREPGAPPELRALIRRSKRIYKKSIIKGLSSVEASGKARDYIERKAKDDNDKNIAASELLNYIAKEYK